MAEAKGAAPPKPEDFGYLSFPKQNEDDFRNPETGMDKLWRKFGENPFIPLGLGLTTFALTYGIWQMKTGDRAMSQKMMRLRVVAQGCTVLAVMGGVVHQSLKARPSS